MKTKIRRLMKRESIENCPENMRGFWQGEVFYKAHKRPGILDSLNIAKMLGMKYAHDINNIMAGDFVYIGEPKLIRNAKGRFVRYYLAGTTKRA